MSVKRKRGLFITFEGTEGCGKSTQIKAIAALLKKKKRPFLLVREPGGTMIGVHIIITPPWWRTDTAYFTG